MEKEIREAYALENPAHAEAKAEVDAENEKHDAAHKEASDGFISENPVPEMGNYDSVEDFNKAMDEWQANYESHMADFEKQYKEDNPKYEDTQKAELRANLLKNLDDKGPILKPDPGIVRIKPDEPTLPLNPIDPGIIWDGPDLPTSPLKPVDSDIPWDGPIIDIEYKNLYLDDNKIDS